MSAINLKFRNILLFTMTAVTLLAACGCDKKASLAEKSVKSDKVVSDKPIADFQIKLLDTAFETASSIPQKPYIKDRCKAQEYVVDTCLKLDQPVRAVRYADKIDDWRRGLCYANAAYYLAQNGYTTEQVQKGLELAEQIAAIDHGQKWRSDRIKAVISQTYALVGKAEQANAFGEDLEDAESGEILRTGPITDKELSFEEWVQKLDKVIALGNFGTTIGALYGYAGLFDLHYDSPDKRDRVEGKIKTAWEKIPLDIRIELLKTMAGTALTHADQSKALALVNDAQVFLDEYQWPLEQYIPVYAKLIELRFKTGDIEKAGTDADMLNTLYDEKVTEIKDIYRAETLYPLAEAYHVIGNTPSALAVYKKAVEGGAVHSVRKYQAEDLSATCCSMAVYAVEPDTELWERIYQIKNGLGQ